MEEAIEQAAHIVGLVLEALAIMVIAIGAVDALIRIVRAVLPPRATRAEKRSIWMDFAGWLTAGLTFQLAADIVQTTVAPTWNDIARVAAIAAIRTFLTYFLDRDIEGMRERQHEKGIVRERLREEPAG